MRVLAISTLAFSLHDERRGGTVVYVASLIDSLTEIADVTVCLMNHPDDLTLPANWRVSLFSAEPIQNVFVRQAMSFLKGIRSAVWQYSSPGLRQYLKSLSPETFDAVVFLEENGAIFEECLHKSIPRILIRHNLNSHSTKIEFSTVRRFLASWSTRYLSKRFDRWTLRRFSQVTVGSKEQLNILLKYRIGQNITRVPTISWYDIPETSRTPPTLEANASCKAVFLGNFDYGPNAEGVDWLMKCEKHFHQETLAILEILLVGASPPKTPSESALRISKLGFVSKLGPLLETCQLGLIPIISGSGVKMKALTLLGSGLAVVATPSGIEGLDVVHGVHCLIAESQEDFAHCVERLLSDIALRSALQRAAKLFINENFSRGAQVLALRSLLERVGKTTRSNYV